MILYNRPLIYRLLDDPKIFSCPRHPLCGFLFQLHAERLLAAFTSCICLCGSRVSLPQLSLPHFEKQALFYQTSLPPGARPFPRR